MGTLTGKTFVVTGATAGIGLYTIKELAKKGAFVIGTGRDPARCETALQSILSEAPHADAAYLAADLSVQAEVRRLAGEIKELLSRKNGGSLYCLINNAGTFQSRFTPTADGIETQLAVNFLAPFLLTHLLFPALSRASDARILTVSSESHYKTLVNWKNVQLKRCYVSLWAYKQSKLFTVLFMRALDKRIRQRGMRAFAVDPGLVDTDIGCKETDLFGRLVWRLRRKAAQPVAQGAATGLHLAQTPDIRSEEVYWRECRECRAAGNSYSEASMRRVWELGEKYCNIRSENYGI